MKVEFKSVEIGEFALISLALGLTLRNTNLVGNTVQDNTQLVYKGYTLCGQLVKNGDNEYTLEAFKNINTLHAFARKIEEAVGKEVVFKIED